MIKKKALLMLSGGLDSILAGKLILDQGIKVEAVHFEMPFHSFRPGKSSLEVSKKAAQKLEIKLKIIRLGNEFLKIVRKPKFGYGAHMNPCIDCRILTFKKAYQYMKKAKAGFIVTGEVLGERPFSQRRNAMIQIDKESGLTGLVVRPLSAKRLDLTIPEEQGVIAREKLLDITGRSRKKQLALAEKYRITEYLTPAGGCLLTDPAFSERVNDLVEHNELSLNEVELIKTGRYLRFSSEVKTVVGRNDEENNRIKELAKDFDILMETSEFPGPTTIVRGKYTEKDIKLAAEITAGYSKGKDKDNIKVLFWNKGSKTKKVLEVKPRFMKNI